ncbi:CBS domain-containing protein [Candidatus Soleaferrea massiliensis]|uniref:CBS domain-containing protein n=1 Tax=Candidatus Soleaferrea massiliensis TaxID=1470354 RepID=UPI00058F0A52|nr:CBS domain-containing protein [Candidatus Soleaferrea massiliensis]
MQVREIMSDAVICCDAQESVTKVAHVMEQHNIGSVPIQQNGELRGIVTDRDIVLRCVAQGKNADHCQAQEVMSTGITYCTPSSLVRDAVEIMAEHRIRRLPVIEDNTLKGFVSLCDAARVKADMEIAKAISEISMD